MSDWERYRRLAPLRPLGDLGRGFAAEVADPLWFLGRQWQLGEHHGEDASSPTLIQADVSHHRIAPLDGVVDGRFDPVKVPTEVLVEAERNQWWTLGRRIRLGRAAQAVLPAAIPDSVRFGPLPAPYAAFEGAVDGYQVFVQGLLPVADPLWAEVPELAPADHWRTDTLAFDATFNTGATTLAITDHDGGDLDWYSVDADIPPDPAAASARQTMPLVPSRMHYPGAPLPRWWQIEDAQVDIGGFPPDRSHFATLLLLEASVMHTDDWFTFPVPSPSGGVDPSVGMVVTLQGVRVKDSFDQWSDLNTPPGAGDPPDPAFAQPWSLFRTHGLDRSALVVWPTTISTLRGPLLDDIALGVDEDANLLWAVELRAEGLNLAPDAASLAARVETTPTGSRQFRYLPSTTLPPHWHPYRIEARGGPPQRLFVQGLVADLRVEPPQIRAGPTSQLLGAGAGHELAAHAVPNSGLRLERRWALARRTTGEPALWVQRRRVPLFGDPVSFMRFDVLAEVRAGLPLPIVRFVLIPSS